MPAKLKNGNVGAPGGKRDGSGRPPDWLKEKCRSIVEKNKLIDFLGDVAVGQDIDQVINENGECLRVPAKVRDRITATELLVDRGWGKVVSGIDLDSMQEAGQRVGVIILPATKSSKE